MLKRGGWRWGFADTPLHRKVTRTALHHTMSGNVNFLPILISIHPRPYMMNLLSISETIRILHGLLMFMGRHNVPVSTLIYRWVIVIEGPWLIRCPWESSVIIAVLKRESIGGNGRLLYVFKLCKLYILMLYTIPVVSIQFIWKQFQCNSIQLRCFVKKNQVFNSINLRRTQYWEYYACAYTPQVNACTYALRINVFFLNSCIVSQYWKLY